MPTEQGKDRATVKQCFAIDKDAWILLHQALCPGSKGIGKLMSEWIRREARERDERPRMLARLAAEQID